MSELRQQHGQLPWRITEADERKGREIVDARGGTVAKLTALDMGNAALIVSAVNRATPPSPSTAHPLADEHGAWGLFAETTLESTASEVGELPRAEQVLRRLLAYRCAGASLYADDGELQDNSEQPHIDFKRDSVDSIETKLIERARAALAAKTADSQAIDDLRVMHEFLQWNRAQEKPPVAIPKEYGVARKVLELAKGKPASVQPSTGEVEVDAERRLLDAVGKLIKAKGRYHTEQNYKALVDAYDAARCTQAEGAKEFVRLKDAIEVCMRYDEWRDVPKEAMQELDAAIAATQSTEQRKGEGDA